MGVVIEICVKYPGVYLERRPLISVPVIQGGPLDDAGSEEAN
jgi:hypothetical protein